METLVQPVSTKAKEKRDRLFGSSRPRFRPYTEGDFWVLWAAYDLGSFPTLKAGAPKEEFAAYINMIRTKSSACLVAEAPCKWFREKRGPVAFISVLNDGWTVLPSIDFFRWTSPRMKMRVVVSAFMKARYSKEIGILMMAAMGGTSRYKCLNKMKTYGLLYPAILGAHLPSREFMYYLRGQKA